MKTKVGNMALIRAAYKGHREVVESLLAAPGVEVLLLLLL